MTAVLLRLFVKNHQDTKNPAVHAAIGKLAGVVGIVCNCALAVGKLVVGLAVGSVAIVSDGANNLSDTASSVMTLLGFRFAQRPADKDHPFGHARYEYISGLAVAALILMIGVELVRSSVEKIFSPTPLELSAVSVAVLLASVVVKLWMALFFRTLGRCIHSETLRAASADSRNDVAATVAVLLGCLANYFFRWNIDGYVGLAVAAFILYSGVGIARETISPLLGRQADGELVENMTALLLADPRVLGVHDLLVHDYGPGQCYASVHVEMSADEDPLACHDVIDELECEALEKLHVHLVIHFDPVVQNDAEQNQMLGLVADILDGLNIECLSRQSVHDFRLVRGANVTKLVFDLSVPYAFAEQSAQIKKKIDEALAQSGKTYVTVIRFDRHA